MKKLWYVFRVKAPSSPKSLLSSYKKELPDELEEFDAPIARFFTDQYNNVMKAQTNVYHYMNPNKNALHFKPLMKMQHLAYLKFRVLKVKTSDDTYEYIITNLPASFSLKDIKDCYHFRWGCEASFRNLKHAAGLLYFHSRKPEFLLQEIYASLTMYNFGIFLANQAVQEYNSKKKHRDNKYYYTVDFSTSIRTARKYLLRGSCGKPTDIIKLLCRYVHAVKEEFRQFPRPLRGIAAVRFNYR